MAEPSLPSCSFDPNKLVLRFESTLPADLDVIGPVIEGVMNLIRQMGCAAGQEFEVELALSEALSNAVRHGCRNDPTKKIQFCVSCDETRGVLIVVRDPGSGFDPASIPSPTVGQQIFPNCFSHPTYAAEVQALRDWIAERLSWLDGQVAGFAGSCP